MYIWADGDLRAWLQACLLLLLPAAALLVTIPTSDAPLHSSLHALAAGTAVVTEGSALEQTLVHKGRFIAELQVFLHGRHTERRERGLEKEDSWLK